MAKQIRRSDIAEADLYKEIRDSAVMTIAQLEKLNTELRKSGQALKNDLTANIEKTYAGLTKIDKAISQANKTMEQSIKIDEAKSSALKTQIEAETQLERLKQETLRTEREAMKNKTMLNREAEKEAKQAEKIAKANRDASDSYKQLVAETRDLKNESKRLGAEMLKLEESGKKNTREYRNLESQYKKVTAQAQRGDEQLKKLDKTVGDNFRNVGNYQTAISGLNNMLGQLGLAFGIGSIVQGAGKTIMEFDQQVQDLRAITGASGQDLQFMRDQAIELGKGVTGGASAVVEAYKLIASAKPELLENAKALDAVTQSAITLSNASGMELNDSATALTDALNQFGAPAEKAGEYIDVLANGAKFGSAEIPQVTDALLKFGAVAKNSNVSVQESTALIEALAEKGLKGAEAGTALRNVMLKLSAPDALPKEAQERLSALGISFDQLKDTSIPFQQRLEALKPLLQDNATMVKVFGAENVVSATNLIENTDRIGQLTEQMYTMGTAQEQAGLRTDTLSFAFNTLTETWNAWLLKVSEGNGVGETLKNLLNFLSKNLETILDVVLKVAEAWVTYKAVTMLSTQANTLLSKSLDGVAEGATRSQRAMAMAGNAVSGLKSAWGSLGEMVKNNAFGLAILALYKLYEAFNVVNTEAEQMEEINGKLMDVEAQHAQQLEQERMELDVLVEAIKGANNENGERDRLITQLNDKYGTTLKNIQDETAFLQELDKIYKDINAKIEKRIALDEARAKFSVIGQEIARLETENLQLDQKIQDAWGQNAFSEFLQGFGDYENTRGVLSEQLTANQKVLQRLIAQREQAKKELTKLMQEEAKNQVTPTGTGSTPTTPTTPAPAPTKTTPTKPKKFNTELETQYELQKEINEAFENEIFLRNTLDKVTREGQIKELDLLITKEQELIDKKIAEGEMPDLTTVENYVKQRQEIMIAGLEAEKKELKRTEQEAIDQTYFDEMNRLYEQKEKLLEQEDITAKAKKEINDNYNTEINKAGEAYLQAVLGQKTRELEIDTEYNGKKEDIVRETENNIEEIRKKKVQAINAVYDRQYEEMKLQLLQSTKTQEEIDKELLDFEIKQLEKRIEALKLAGEDTLQYEIQLAELKRGIRDGETTAITDAEKDRAEAQIAIVEGLTEAFIALADKRIAKIDEEISKAQERYNTYADLAKNGNIQAQQSLAVEAKLIAEQNRLKEREEKKKQRIQLASSVLTAYMKNSSDPDVKNPLTKTITDTVLLTEFIKNLPMFESGIENTGKNGQGVDGRGGFHAILHPEERVMTRNQNKMIGNLSNEELAKLANDYQNGMISNIGSGAVKIGSGWNSMEVVKKLENIENVIRNKPETNIHVEEIVSGAMTITRQTKQGNDTIYNRYRIKAK